MKMKISHLIFKLDSENRADINLSKFDNVESIKTSVIPALKECELYIEEFAPIENYCVLIHTNFKLNILGDFISPNKLPVKHKFNVFREPNLTKDRFISKIDQWLKEFAVYMKDPSKISIEYDKDLLSADDIEAENLRKGIMKIEEDMNSRIPSQCMVQAYSLRITPNFIIISSWTKQGAYYGLLSLAQLINNPTLFKLEHNMTAELALLPICKVIDYPDYEFRGLEDDISRGQRPTLETFKDTIRYLSSLKLNAYALYIEDMFKFDKYPKIGQGRNPLTKELIKELDDYALEYFIDLQPAVEMFGHMDNILTIPEFRKYGEFDGAQCFNIASDETKRFVDDLLKELCGAFNSRMFHLICDESFDFGLYKSREYVQKKGKAEALAEWYLYLVDIIEKYGDKIPGFAHDIIIHYPKTMGLVKDRLPIIFYWSYSNKKKYKGISKLIKNGFDVAGVPSTFDWSRHYPYTDYAEKNTIYMAKDALERGAKSLVTTKFGDFFNENLRENIRYGIAIEAAASWNVNSNMLWDKKGRLDCRPLKDQFIKFYLGIINEKVVDRTIECMEILSSQNKYLPSFPNGMMNRFWLDPFVREISNKEIHYLSQFIEDSLKVFENLKIIKDLEDLEANNIESGMGYLRKNISYHLDYIEFAARMSLHYAVKIIVAEALWRGQPKEIKRAIDILSKISKKRYKEGKSFEQIKDFPNLEDLYQKDLEDFKRSDLAPIVEWLIKDIREMAEIYSDLWLRQNVKEGLEYPHRRFRRLEWYYQQINKMLKEDKEFINNPEKKPSGFQLKSEWIWISGLRTSYTWGNRKKYYFLKDFSLPKDKKIKRAYLQGIVNNWMNIYLDGHYIGEVLSRFSLSQLPMAKSVQLFDITDILQQNSIFENHLIEIEAANYPNGIGGLNIYVYIEFKEESKESSGQTNYIEIISDKSWWYTETKPEPWPIKDPEVYITQRFKKASKNSKISIGKLRKVRSFGRPPLGWNGPISAPILNEQDLIEDMREFPVRSEISFIYALRNFIETSITTFVGEKVFKYLFWLVPFGARLMGTDIFGFRKL
ncbi:MAG: family 20 glycosylhydrolase [Promethearchaeota archaeon]